jgi:hypothetical protein
LTDQERADREMTEAAFRRRVLYRARKYGWTCLYVQRAVVGGTEDAPIIRTPTGKDGKGFPDLLLVKAGRTPIFAELKKELGRPSDEQWEWLDLLISAGQNAVVWRPSQLKDIEVVLRG